MEIIEAAGDIAFQKDNGAGFILAPDGPVRQQRQDIQLQPFKNRNHMQFLDQGIYIGRVHGLCP